jgi:two-component system sensor histidine kinase BarA
MATLLLIFLFNAALFLNIMHTGMLGFAELLEVTNLNETQREYLRTMQASASSLMSVINDLLDFSKMYVSHFYQHWHVG